MNIPNQNMLESFFVNNVILHRIESYLNRFNPIRTMRMEGMELRHSAILAWLLDPRETHGFADKFLRAFLCEAMRGQSALGTPTALEISQADLRDADVRREWQNIDIFIILPRLNWSFIIENKFHSSQSEGQLSKYASLIKSVFEPQEGALKIRGIFLTLHDEPPADENFVPIQYAAICDIIPNLMHTEAETVRKDVATFVKHYVEIIREAAGMSEERNEMENLARQLYRSHKKVLDFIMEYGATTDFVIAMEAIFGGRLEYGDYFKVEKHEFMFDWHSNVQVSFIPRGWVEKLGEDLSWEGCENWWAEYPLICWFQIFDDEEGSSGSLRLVAEIGPISNYEFRVSLIQAIKNVAVQNDLKYVRFQKMRQNKERDIPNFLKIIRYKLVMFTMQKK